ncbi:hypothetical protein [uncultured Desulfovibrio sp.]|uniref:hypothetical protein n=1 Tax=uncultured Desulfovibrio sp. TaxID=167968 RepID=UPI002619A9B1|nr:hypothetical protein [uncultured Desulfovibrio sp.]
MSNLWSDAKKHHDRREKWKNATMPGVSMHQRGKRKRLFFNLKMPTSGSPRSTDASATQKRNSAEGRRRSRQARRSGERTLRHEGRCGSIACFDEAQKNARGKSAGAAGGGGQTVTARFRADGA